MNTHQDPSQVHNSIPNGVQEETGLEYDSKFNSLSESDTPPIQRRSSFPAPKLSLSAKGFPPVIQKRDILNSPKYTDNFKARHIRAGNVTENVAADRLNNNPPPPSSTVIDEKTVPKGPAKNAEDSKKISEKFTLSAQGWNAYTEGGNVKAKQVQSITVSKDQRGLINHLDSCVEVGDAKIKQADGSWQ